MRVVLQRLNIILVPNVQLYFPVYTINMSRLYQNFFESNSRANNKFRDSLSVDIKHIGLTFNPNFVS